MSVRNVAAFRVLQNAFVHARSTYVASTLLDVVCGIYQQDAANYFIVADQNTLCAFAERIAAHATCVQRKFFSILEFVVQLDYVPYRELVMLSNLVRSVPSALRPSASGNTGALQSSAVSPSATEIQSSLRCATLCMRTLIKMLHYDPRHKDAFEQLGLLDSFVCAAQRFADELAQRAIAQKSRMSASASASACPSVSDTVLDAVPGGDEHSAAWCAFELLVLRALELLVDANAKCASVFVERGGVALLLAHINGHETSRAALDVFAKLLLTASNAEELLAALLSVFHTASVTYFCAAPRSNARDK